jgi:hypothetical protein
MRMRVGSLSSLIDIILMCDEASNFGRFVIDELTHQNGATVIIRDGNMLSLPINGNMTRTITQSGYS